MFSRVIYHFAGCHYTFQYLFGVLYMEGLYNIFQSKTVLADPKRGASTWQVVSKVANFSGNIFRKAEISPQHMLRVLPVFSRERILRIYLSAFRRSTLLVNIRGRDKKMLPTKKHQTMLPSKYCLADGSLKNAWSIIPLNKVDQPGC